MGRGDPSMPTVNPSGWKTLPDEKRVSLGWVAPTVAFAGVVARVESLPLASLGDNVRGGTRRLSLARLAGRGVV